MARRKKQPRMNKRSAGPGRADGPLSPALSGVIRDILKWAAEQNYPAALVGAVAVCLHGSVRPTDDVDLLVLTNDAPARVLASLEKAGYEPRFADPVAFAEDSRVLLVRHVKSEIDVDIVFGLLPFERECVFQAVVKQAAFGKVRLATPEALCVMKLIAGRPHDLRDAAQLVEIFVALDRRWVVEQVRQFAELMEAPEVLKRAQIWSRG